MHSNIVRIGALAASLMLSTFAYAQSAGAGAGDGAGAAGAGHGTAEQKCDPTKRASNQPQCDPGEQPK